MKQRDIILVPFPFSDQSGVKVRPALIVSNDNFNNSGGDVLICAATSNIKAGKYSVIIGPDDVLEGALFEKSCIKAENLLKINKSLIIKKIASLKEASFSHVKEILKNLF
ncbi:type II toxin-antitoxin system PemK/MazF family toxin [Candidatus Woesearchaeota archaeon]|nr:type II toxin-antitoxin system PemK/MazF family toxin [Candidatus Woesearchaeota archaeon]